MNMQERSTPQKYFSKPLKEIDLTLKCSGSFIYRTKRLKNKIYNTNKLRLIYNAKIERKNCKVSYEIILNKSQYVTLKKGKLLRFLYKYTILTKCSEKRDLINYLKFRRRKILNMTAIYPQISEFYSSQLLVHGDLMERIPAAEHRELQRHQKQGTPTTKHLAISDHVDEDQRLKQ